MRWLILLSIIVLSACTVGHMGIQSMSTQEAQRLLMREYLTEADVRERLGEPSYIEYSDENAIFVYSWLETYPSPWNWAPWTLTSVYPTTKKDLRIWFDRNGQLTKHELSGLYYERHVPLFGIDSIENARPLSQAELDANGWDLQKNTFAPETIPVDINSESDPW